MSDVPPAKKRKVAKITQFFISQRPPVHDAAVQPTDERPLQDSPPQDPSSTSSLQNQTSAQANTSAATTSSVAMFHGLPLSVDRLISLHPFLRKSKEKDGKRTRIMVKCLTCSMYESDAKRASGNNQVVPYSTGARTEGESGAKRLIEHLKGKPHQAAEDARKLCESFQRQTDKHPWLKLFNKYRVQEVKKLVKLAMDVYNDTMCETVSAFSWPSRSLTSELSDRLLEQFSEDWDSPYTSFTPTGLEMHYRDPDIYFEMLRCIADKVKEATLQKIKSCDGYGVQIDGSSDRQQLGVKFVTARVIKNHEMFTVFVAAMEPVGKGAAGLLEALGRSLEHPGDLAAFSLQFKDNCDEDGDLLRDAAPIDFQNSVFSKLLVLSTDGEAANTGPKTGLWRKLQDEVGRFVLCIWCICHRTDLAFHDMVSSVAEIKHWYSQLKESVKYFRLSTSRTKIVKTHCSVLKVTFKAFVNPPDVRFAEHILDMCSCMLENYRACIATWDELSSSADETSLRRQAAGFRRMWDLNGMQYRLTALMADILHHLSCLQKEFQKADLLLFDIPEIQERYVQRIAAMESKPYPGGAEESFYNVEDSDEERDCPIPPQSRKTHNRFVTRSDRSILAVRQEAVMTLKQRLEERIDEEQSSVISNLKAVFDSRNAEEMAGNGRTFLEMLKMESVHNLMDQCIDLFVMHSELRDPQLSLKKRFEIISGFAKNPSPLGLLVDLVISAVPHSMSVERTISHYNNFRSDRRLSMSLQGVNDRLMIALNGPGTSHFDPRPAVAAFLQSKQRRYKEPNLEKYEQRAFMKNFFRGQKSSFDSDTV